MPYTPLDTACSAVSNTLSPCAAQELNDKRGGKSKPSQLKVETRPAWVEITALGCRGMKPYLFRPMASPFVTFAVQTPEGTKVRCHASIPTAHPSMVLHGLHERPNL